MDITAWIVLGTFAVEMIAAGVLVKQITSQKQMMEGWKNLVDTIDPAKLKAATALIEEGIEMKHKLWAAKQMEQVSEDLAKESLAINKGVTDQYNELYLFALNILEVQTPVVREMLLGKLPHTQESIRNYRRQQGKAEGVSNPQ